MVFHWGDIHGGGPANFLAIYVAAPSRDVGLFLLLAGSGSTGTAA